jgi:hypothetical protein
MVAKGFLTDENRDALFLVALVCLSTSIPGFPFDQGIPDPVKSYLIWLVISKRMAIRTIADRIAKQLKGGIHKWEEYIEARMGMFLVRWLLFLPLLLITMGFFCSRRWLRARPAAPLQPPLQHNGQRIQCFVRWCQRYIWLVLFLPSSTRFLPLLGCTSVTTLLK